MATPGPRGPEGRNSNRCNDVTGTGRAPLPGTKPERVRT